MPDKEDKRARHRATQQAAAARRRKEELARRRRGRIIGLAILVGLAVLTVFVVGAQTGEDEGAPPDSAGEQSENEEPTASEGESGDCDFSVEPPENDARQYEQPASQEQVLSVVADYFAVIETNCGVIEVDLLEQEAPAAVANFIFLAEDGYYDGLTWHRVIEEFVIQSGDPEGTGKGGPGYEFEDELPEDSSVYTFGAMAMANSGPDTNGSQFFIVSHAAKNALEGEETPAPAGLQQLYSHFGQATEESYETIAAIASVETSSEPETQDRPVEPVYILSVTIEER